MSRRTLGWLSLLLLAITTQAFGQGVLVDQHVEFRLPRPIFPHPHPRPWPQPRPRPEPPASYKIKDLSINASLTDQVAKVQVSQTFVNTGSRQMEVAFIFPLPYDGAIDRLTFMVDGKEYDGKLLDAKEARRIYESYMRRQKDPALLEWLGSGMFKTSVFPVPAGAQRSVSLRYTQVCRRQHGMTEFTFPLSTAKYTSQPIETVNVSLNIQSQDRIKNVFSPTHSVQIKRPGNQNATVTYQGKNEVPQSDFRLFFDVGDQPLATSVLSYRPDPQLDGYFLMLASPDIKPVEGGSVNKSVLLVIDRSGSMNGKKIEQAKEAMRYVLNNLHEGDTFNIVAYDSAVESFRPEIQRYDEETRAAALGFVNGIYAGGSTNIDGALKSALSQLKDTSRPSYLLFLTDGLPTTGEQNLAKIVANSKDYNNVRARLLTFGVGFDVNSRLLDKLAHTNHGQSEYVRPDESIETYVSKLYDRIGSPVLTNVAVTFDLEGLKPEDGPAATRVYPRGEIDLFAGEQLMMVGRYAKPGAAKVILKGQVQDESRTYDFPAQLVNESHDETYAFVEKLWAVRRVGEIIDQIDLNGKNQELVDELVGLATKHGILTPYTSFLADDQVNLSDLASVRGRTDEALIQLSAESGQSGFYQRSLKGNLQRARLAAPSSYGGYGAPSSNSSSGYGYGAGGYGRVPRPAGSQLGGRGGGGYGAAGGEDGSPRKDLAQAIKYVGAKTFFLRGEQWIDSAVVDRECEKQTVKRSSDDSFTLLSKHGRDVAKYLAMEGDIVVQFGKDVYLVTD